MSSQLLVVLHCVVAVDVLQVTHGCPLLHLPGYLEEPGFLHQSLQEAVSHQKQIMMITTMILNVWRIQERPTNAVQRMEKGAKRPLVHLTRKRIEPAAPAVEQGN